MKSKISQRIFDLILTQAAIKYNSLNAKEHKKIKKTLKYTYKGSSKPKHLLLINEIPIAKERISTQQQGSKYGKY